MRDDRHRLQQVLSTGERLLEVVEQRGIDREAIERDDEVQWMLTTPLYHIGEQVNNLSEELTDRYREIPWSAIAGLRHRLVHDYEDTDWQVIEQVVFHDLRPFLPMVREILERL